MDDPGAHTESVKVLNSHSFVLGECFVIGAVGLAEHAESSRRQSFILQIRLLAVVLVLIQLTHAPK